MYYLCNFRFEKKSVCVGGEGGVEWEREKKLKAIIAVSQSCCLLRWEHTHILPALNETGRLLSLIHFFKNMRTALKGGYETPKTLTIVLQFTYTLNSFRT